METSEIGIFLNKSWRPQLRLRTLCFSAWAWLVSAAATQGWAWCNHDAELVERNAPLRNHTTLQKQTGIFVLRNLWVSRQLSGTFTKRWIPLPNSAKSCIFEGTFICQQIKAESQGTVAQQSNLSISGQIQNLRQRDGIFCKHNASKMQSFCQWRESFSSIFLNASETRLCYLSVSSILYRKASIFNLF